MTLKTVTIGNKSAVLSQKADGVWPPTALLDHKSMTENESDTDSSDVECPTCGRTDFASETGMKCHHAQVHGESIAGFKEVCEWCGDEFEVDERDPDRKFCGRDCYDKKQSEDWKGENNPNWKNDIEKTCRECGDVFTVPPHKSDKVFCDQGCHMQWHSRGGETNPNWTEPVDTSCKWCGDTFQVNPHASNKPFCSRECHMEWMGKNWQGEGHPRWVGRIEKECEWCENEFSVVPSQSDRQFCCRACMVEWQSFRDPEEHPRWTEGDEKTCIQCESTFRVTPSQSDRQFCDRSCKYEWQSEQWRGEDNPFWRGGDEMSYGPNWPTIREAAIVRDDEVCQVCGLNREAHYDTYGRDFDVHHLTPRRSFDSYQDANQMDNLTTLCVACHGAVEWERQMDGPY